MGSGVLQDFLTCLCHGPPWPQMMGSVTRSKRALAEIFESGSNILVNMAGNRERLKVMWASCRPRLLSAPPAVAQRLTKDNA